MANSKNDAVISGNHHHSVGNGTLRSSQGMTGRAPLVPHATVVVQTYDT